MTAPASPLNLLPSSPLSLGQAISSTIDIVKRRFGLFVGLAALPLVAGAVVMLVAVAAIGVFVYQAIMSGDSFTPAAQIGAPLAWGLVFLGLALFAVALLQIKLNGMIVLLAYETSQGRHPSFHDLNAGTRGIVLRALPVVLAFTAGAVVALGVVSAALFAPLVAGVRSGSGSSSDAAIAGVVGLLMLVYLAAGIGALYFGTRWLYFSPALAIEGRGGFSSLGRSWALTARDFWRTLGWYLLGSLLVGVATTGVQLVGSAVLAPLQFSASGSDPLSAATGSALILVSIVYAVVIVLVQMLTVPLLQTYVTIMYVDQVRRSDLLAAGVPLRWAPDQYQSHTGFTPYQGQPYPPAQQGYPAQPFAGQPGQGGYPAPSTPPYFGPPPQNPPSTAPQYPPSTAPQYPPPGRPDGETPRA